jgi:hypothetical protein
MAFNAPALRQAVARVRAEAPPVHIAVGGGVCEWIPNIATEVGADASGGDAAALVQASRQLFGLDHA